MIKQYVRPQLGSWHTITHRAKKFKNGERVDWYSEPIQEKDNRRGKYFSQTDDCPGHGWVPAPDITEYQAMYIGYRYKQNGNWEMGNYPPLDEWDDRRTDYFNVRELVEVWLFVTHDNRNPIEVMPFPIALHQREAC